MGRCSQAGCDVKKRRLNHVSVVSGRWLIRLLGPITAARPVLLNHNLHGRRTKAQRMGLPLVPKHPSGPRIGHHRRADTYQSARRSIRRGPSHLRTLARLPVLFLNTAHAYRSSLSRPASALACFSHFVTCLPSSYHCKVIGDIRRMLCCDSECEGKVDAVR